MKRPGTATILAFFSATLSACTVGPNYERPPAATPAAYKENSGWKPSRPLDAIDRGAWWSIYSDSVLDKLERQIDVTNQNLRVSEAAYRQARAVAQAARASLFPTLNLSGSAQRSSTPSSTIAGGSRTVGSRVVNDFNLALGASWEPDIWGKIRRTVESDVATAQASAADLAAARLSAQTALATDYFQLRAQDELKNLLEATAVAYTQSLQITRNQYAAGVASRADVVLAETQLKQTQAQAINVGVLRAQLEHAIAALIGKAPSELSIAPTKLTADVPVVPTDVPSTLLERRPDIAAGERAVASANAQIGVAISAYYPTVTLSASYGVQSTMLSSLLQESSTAWSFGPSATETIFDAGARGAQVDAARAFYDQTIATYRQTVITSFQQVEDELSSLRILEQQASAQDDAVKSAQEGERLTLNQYKAGTVPYTSVITAQATALSNEQTALTIQANRLVASIALVGALGGGWDASQLPTADFIEDAENPGNPANPANAEAACNFHIGSYCLFH